jgi:type I restriction-modification system DNA methylase subunit
MGLFQHSVLNKYLKEANQDEMQAAWKKLVAYFQNPVIQQNIRESKEEQFQEGFLTELFVKVFGYTINPNPDYNLTTEYKNERGAKKADGAILKETTQQGIATPCYEAIGVIELKSTTTKDLEAIRLQAFDYKANQSKCVYVITSNFEKVRFYIHNAVEFEEFDLFRLNYEHFQLMWLCLAKDNLLGGIPLQMKEASILKEENVTKQIYVDYSLFKHDLYNDLVANNLNLALFTGKTEKEIKLLLFKKSQKLLDRFLFILFSEDRGLLPPNSISEIIKQWENQSDWGDNVKLYDRYKKYFHLLNTGWKGKKHEIFAYNGGLFAPDEILDSLVISDEVLKKHTEVLTAYDFETEVDVNILGHIFENSLNEIEEVTAELEGEDIDRKKGKRKKDGVFYTPKYITKYIVENTVGKLCEEKKTELSIDESEYLKSRKGRTTKKLKELDGKLDEYRNWLLSLTICDPACGSGAFLNQALDFLIREHRYIDELRAKLLDVPMVFTEVENSILENNIYGVDINEESVEIAKLSLWLRTAQKGRKLTTLSNNIKCGNSLIDDPEVAGEKALNWQTEFPEVFKNGGFDVVIGNPPYVQLQKMGEMSEKLKSSGFETFDSGSDLYCLFTERGFHLLKKGGLQSFIMPNKWLLVAYGKPLRKFMAKTGLRQVLNFGDIQFFPEATTYVCIFVTQKSKPGKTVKVLSLNKKTYHGDFLTEVKANLYDYPSDRFGEKEWSIQPYADFLKLEKMKLTGTELKELPIIINNGIKTGFNNAFLIDDKIREKLISEDAKSAELIKPMVRGRGIIPYGVSESEFLINTHNGIKDKNPPVLPVNIQQYPAIKKHLDTFYAQLEKRGDKGETPYNLRNCAYLVEFLKPKIIYPEITAFFPFFYDESGLFCNNKNFILTAQDDSISLPFLTAVFNSSLAKLWIWYNCPELQGGTREIRKVYFEHFPVPQANEEQTKTLSKLALNRTELTGSLKEITSKFIRTIQRKFNLEKMSNKLQQWYLLSYAEFIKELSKKKAKLSLTEEAEWEDYFNEQKQKALSLKSEIDRMVYELYGLTEEEIGVVENSDN